MQEVANEINKMKRASPHPLLVLRSRTQGIPFPQVTSYKGKPEAGYHHQTRLRITSLHGESTTVNQQCGLPIATPSTSGK